MGIAKTPCPWREPAENANGRVAGEANAAEA